MQAYDNLCSVVLENGEKKYRLGAELMRNMELNFPLRLIRVGKMYAKKNFQCDRCGSGFVRKHGIKGHAPWSKRCERIRNLKYVQLVIYTLSTPL